MSGFLKVSEHLFLLSLSLPTIKVVCASFTIKEGKRLFTVFCGMFSHSALRSADTHMDNWHPE